LPCRRRGSARAGGSVVKEKLTPIISGDWSNDRDQSPDPVLPLKQMKKTYLPTIDDMIELPEPGDAQISPDGSQIAYIVKKVDWKQNDSISQIWLVKTNGSEPRQLTFSSQSSFSPRWSPDGKHLAFLSKREGDRHIQIYRISTDGGEAERLAEIEGEIQSISWSPQGDSLAFSMPDPESSADKERKEKFGEYRVEDKDYTRCHLWLLELENKKCRKLTHGEDHHIVSFTWSPTGVALAFVSYPTPDMKDLEKGRIFTIQPGNLEIKGLTGPGCNSPCWSLDGTNIAFEQAGTSLFYKNNQVCIIPAAGGEPQVVKSNFDEQVMLKQWGPNGVFFVAMQRTSIHLFRLNPENGEVAQMSPNDPPGWFGWEYSFSRDFRFAAAPAADNDHSLEICLLHVEDGAVSRLTNFNAAISDWQLGRHESFKWASQDGTPIEGILTKPVDFDPSKKYPLLVVIHGGPDSASLLTLLDTYERRYYPIQQWVNKGALILEPNYRGSGGYGEAFRSLNVRNLGVGDYEDVISGVDALIAKGWVDPERVGSMGWSQGGYISAFITTFSERFKAVSVGAGISDWMTYYVNTDIHPFTRQYLAATPWEDAEVYARTSPITYIRRAKTPTLIQHGEGPSKCLRAVPGASRHGCGSPPGHLSRHAARYQPAPA
jgi:dipeptidyl aminopeptidase/acylaminoacyl peptidase